MGGGAASVGGRNSSAKVFEVTTLADSGAGSLRAALAASGPRYVVFRTNGLITNKSRMALGNPFCTIAGHTAPGTVCIGGPNQSGEALFISTHDVVVKGLSFDGSNPNLPPGPDNGSVGFELASGLISNVIYDHCSLRWNSNKLWISYANGQPITNITVQNCLMYEPNVGHPVGPMTDASSLAQECFDQDFCRNVMINLGHRIPLYNTARGRWVNNLVYNYDYFALLAQGGVSMDIIGNNYVFGNLNKGNSNPHPFGFSAIQSTDDTTQKMPGPGSFFLQGNICAAYQTDPNGDQTLMCAKLDGEGTAEVGPPPLDWYRSSPMPLQKYPIVALPVGQLDSLVSLAGNSQHLQADGSLAPNNDSQDARVIAQYSALGPGGQYAGPDYNGPTVAPPIAQGTPYPSSQHDGISDVWKQKFQLDTSDPGLFNKISPNAGIPYIECFLYGVTP